MHYDYALNQNVTIIIKSHGTEKQLIKPCIVNSYKNFYGHH